MFDPFGNMQNLINQFSGFMSNPVQYLMQRKLNLPQGALQDPNKAIQQLMNSGAMTQQQYTMLSQMASQIKDSPEFMQFMQNMYGNK